MSNKAFITSLLETYNVAEAARTVAMDAYVFSNGSHGAMVATDIAATEALDNYRMASGDTYTPMVTIQAEAALMEADKIIAEFFKG
jgi:phosphosulfolactate phosphohydrolase-like enzyme